MKPAVVLFVFVLCFVENVVGLVHPKYSCYGRTNEKYTNSYDSRCDSYCNVSNSPCPAILPNVDGCYCNKGYYRNSEGICVESWKCGPFFQPPVPSPFFLPTPARSADLCLQYPRLCYSDPASPIPVSPFPVSPFSVSPVLPFPVEPIPISPIPVLPFPVSPFSVSPFSVSSFSVSPFPVSKFPVSPFPVSPFPISPFSISPFPVEPILLSPFPVEPIPMSPFSVSPIPKLPIPVSPFPVSTFSLSPFPVSPFAVSPIPAVPIPAVPEHDQLLPAPVYPSAAYRPLRRHIRKSSIMDKIMNNQK